MDGRKFFGFVFEIVPKVAKQPLVRVFLHELLQLPKSIASIALQQLAYAYAHQTFLLLKGRLVLVVIQKRTTAELGGPIQQLQSYPLVIFNGKRLFDAGHYKLCLACESMGFTMDGSIKQTNYLTTARRRCST